MAIRSVRSPAAKPTPSVQPPAPPASKPTTPQPSSLSKPTTPHQPSAVSKPTTPAFRAPRRPPPLGRWTASPPVRWRA